MNRHALSPAHSLRRSAVGRAVADLLRQLGSILQALEHRREVKALTELDERTLKDIGLLRSDVDGALSEPFFRNPSAVLVRCVERRARVQARGGKPAAARPMVPLVKAVS